MNKEKINDMNEELENILEEGRNLLDEFDLEERLNELKTEAELLIRKYPLKSVLAGVAAGIVLARILRR